MTKFYAVLAAAPLALCSQAAFAAPLSGPYIGIEGSHDAYEVKAQNTNIGGTAISADGLSGNGVSGGIYAGYDIRVMPSAFVGIEAGFDYSGAAISVAGGGDSASVKARESYSIAGRFGLVVGNATGLYAKLGYANTRFKTELVSSGTTVFADSRSHGAFVYGGGIETSVTDRLSVRGEFTVSDYGSAGLNEDLGTNGIKVSNSKTSVGVSYRF